MKLATEGVNPIAHLRQRMCYNMSNHAPVVSPANSQVAANMSRVGKRTAPNRITMSCDRCRSRKTKVCWHYRVVFPTLLISKIISAVNQVWTSAFTVDVSQIPHRGADLMSVPKPVYPVTTVAVSTRNVHLKPGNNARSHSISSQKKSIACSTSCVSKPFPTSPCPFPTYEN